MSWLISSVPTRLRLAPHVALGLLTLATNAFAQQAAGDAADGRPDLLPTMLRMTIGLIIVIGLVYLTLNFGLRRMMGIQGAVMGKSRLVTVLERIPLDQRRTMFVVRAGDEYLLIGGGEMGLQLLSKLDTVTVERIQKEREQDRQKPVQLSPFLQKLLVKKEHRTPREPPSSGPVA